MRPKVVVFLPPVFDHDTRFGQRIKHLSIETFVAQTSVETLDVTILPGAAQLNVERLDRLGCEPCS